MCTAGGRTLLTGVLGGITISASSLNPAAAQAEFSGHPVWSRADDCEVNLDVDWHAGWPSPKHDPAPEIQSHAANEHTIIMRQNKSVNYEAPFLFLLFGNESALLIDTGATAEPEYFPLRRTVDAHIDDWLARHPRDEYPLLVVHTHGHGDHKAADAQFTDREDTTVVGADLDYPRGWTYQPDEAALPMTVGRLRELQRVVREIGGATGVHKFDDFHIWYGV